jgi:alcohol dehydrogenase (cytochrome c)
VIAIDASTGERKWKYAMTDVTDSGILTTASDVLFTGQREGYFHVFNARTGELLWKASLGGQIVNGPITHQVDGKQYVAPIAGQSSWHSRYATERRGNGQGITVDRWQKPTKERSEGGI